MIGLILQMAGIELTKELAELIGSMKQYATMSLRKMDDKDHITI